MLVRVSSMDCLRFSWGSSEVIRKDVSVMGRFF